MPYSTVVVVRNWNLPSLMVLDERDILVGIAGLIKCDVSCYAVNLYILKGVADGGGIGGACVLYGLDGSQVGIVTQGGNSRDNVFLLFLLPGIPLKPLMKAAASSLAGSASSKKVEITTPPESAPAFSMMVEFSHVSPAAMVAVIPSSLACLMINGAVVMEGRGQR